MIKCEIKAKHFENITRNHSLQRPCPKNKKSTLDQEFKCFQWGEDQSVDGDSPARNY